MRRIGVGREPAMAFLPALVTVVSVIAQAVHLSAANTSLVTAIVTALGGVVVAATARPWAPTVVAAAVTAALALFSDTWLHLPSAAISYIAVTVTVAIGLLLRHQITPVVVPTSE
jgi:hypothetical protein